ncbi:MULTISPECIES: GntR family transcriptional regulator [unclassified Rhizobium]|jgi:DNA-binding GntR family transcriptional regulator|uniref:GntR family transcriptional regulator n=1 Tax=Rhizobium/Agrobacterium group TaxID=227290 RepID=UPI0008A7C0BF|nr:MULTISPECIES: GntR family transcriptional regulator [unclassified Rhizobium]MBP2459413.1 DNA-binding GntR family transcriptional regulator [Rhizobium sp. PvP014]MBP2531708.1 DNA-binding GntR family transcriptional regulator [Rhizobium sp. PvP099]RYE66411.1 MAG: GntR family transcriptional regulator [Rhizobiaceae bacterium]SEH30210.1 DNA-binding transcriptional regulator, GntR family [Rhizobium sp. NFR12]
MSDTLPESPVSPSGPIRRTALHDTLVTRLRDMIIEGELAPGSRMHESQLGEQLGVSRTPLREAIKYLASEGLVELIPSRGAIVKRFSGKDVHDMLIVLKNLEELAGSLACETATDDDIARVRQLHDEMRACYDVKDRLRYYKLNQAIHTEICRIADNQALSSVQAQLQSRLKRIRFIGHEGPDKWSAAMAEHEEMIVALEARDGETLSKVLGLHLLNAWQRVKDAI